MDVLVCLAEHQGEVVKKEQFFETTWGDVNVTPHVLARAISEIRRTLSDEPQNPLFIQTVPKIGYRLIAPVSPGRTHGADAATPFQPSLVSQANFAYLPSRSEFGRWGYPCFWPFCCLFDDPARRRSLEVNVSSR